MEKLIGQLVEVEVETGTNHYLVLDVWKEKGQWQFKLEGYSDNVIVLPAYKLLVSLNTLDLIGVLQ